MEVKIGIAKMHKYAITDCGDSVEFATRPRGGISAILADGQGNGTAAKLTSMAVVNKAAALIADGARDGAVARAVHDYLYVLKNGRVSSTLTILSADQDTETVVFCRNSNCPVLVKNDYGIDVYDEAVNPIGVNKRMKPLTTELAMETGLILVTYSDGIQAAGRKHGAQFDFAYLQKLIHDVDAQDADYLAQAILEYAVELDKNRPSDDMTVMVLGVSAKEAVPKVQRISVSFPL